MLTRCPNCFREYESKLGLCPFCGFAPGDSAQDPQALLPGTILADRFVVGAVRNKTSQTILYDAWDQLHNQKVMAWEYFPADLAERSPDGLRVVSPQNETVFSRGKELYSARSIFLHSLDRQPGLLPTLDHFSANRTEYRITPHVEGEPLHQRLEGTVGKTKPFTQTASQICKAFDLIHRQGAILSGISPDSFWMTEDGEFLFMGLDDIVLPGTGSPCIDGNSPYAPPEERSSVAGNIYSLGAVFYHFLTHRTPQSGMTRLEDDLLLPPSEVDPTIPLHISQAVMKAMSLDSRNRFPTAMEFGQELEQPTLSTDQENGDVEEPVASPPLSSPANYRSFYPMLMGVTCFIVVALVVLGIWYAVSNQPQAEVAPTSSGESSTIAASQSSAISDLESQQESTAQPTTAPQATATPLPSPTPFPSPTPEPEPEQIDSVNYQIQRQDRSVYNENGESILEFYYDLVVLEGSSAAVSQINSTLYEECQTYLDANQSSVDDTISQFNPRPNSGYANATSAQVIYNENGVISIVYSLNWMMGGVHNLNYFGMTFDLNTGEQLSLTSLFPFLDPQESEVYVKAKCLQYLFDNPEDGWNDGAKETIEYYDTETMDFCIDHGEIMVFFESYELKSGMAGPVSIPLGINYPVHEADDLQTFLTTGSNEYGSGWSFLDTSLDRDENPIVETLYFREDGTATYIRGYYATDRADSQEGTYSLDGNILTLDLYSDSTGETSHLQFQVKGFADSIIISSLNEQTEDNDFPSDLLIPLYDVYANQ